MATPKETQQVADKVIKTVNPPASDAVKTRRQKIANVVKELEKSMREK